MAGSDRGPGKTRGAAASIRSAPGALGLLGASVAARLPLAMFSLGLLVHAQRRTGSFAVAGVVAGAYAAAEGVGGPLLGRLVDRRGQTVVLLASAAAAALLLGAIALVPRGTPVAILVLLAAATGLATPPVGACLRALLPEVLADPAALRSAYAFEASALELTFVAGPPLVLGAGSLWSSGAALAIGGAMLLASTVLFVLQPASRGWRPQPRVGVARGGSLRAPAMRTLVVLLVAVGVLFGAVEVGVTAAAQSLGATATAGPLLAVWGIGSLVGGVLAARAGGGARSARGLSVMLVALALGHVALFPARGSVLAIGLVLFFAGAAIAPVYASVYAMVDDAAPAGTVTEAFAWLATAVAVGAAAGAAGGGVLADVAGPGAAFVLAGAAGMAAVVVTMLRGQTLASRVDAARRSASGEASLAPVLVRV